MFQSFCITILCLIHLLILIFPTISIYNCLIHINPIFIYIYSSYCLPYFVSWDIIIGFFKIYDYHLDFKVLIFVLLFFFIQNVLSRHDSPALKLFCTSFKKLICYSILFLTTFTKTIAVGELCLFLCNC